MTRSERELRREVSEARRALRQLDRWALPVVTRARKAQRELGALRRRLKRAVHRVALEAAAAKGRRRR